MRIVSGIYGGRRLEAPRGTDIRPTSDKVRGSIFNILRGSDVLEGAQVLDVFCGTGALGLEALSNGAAHCVFIDHDRRSLDLARRNAQNLGVKNCQFILHNAKSLKEHKDGLEPADLVFMDPPYGKGLAVPALAALDKKGWLAEGAVIVVEVEKGFADAIEGSFVMEDERVYGENRVLFLRYNI